ncbi:MAG: hypothetical protein ACR2H4_01300 [Pyrinomonadaceae bacterium]
MKQLEDCASISYIAVATHRAICNPFERTHGSLTNYLLAVGHIRVVVLVKPMLVREPDNFMTEIGQPLHKQFAAKLHTFLLLTD